MPERFSIKRIAFLSAVISMTFWLVYGMAWEVSYDLTTPPLSISPGGRPIEHTVGIYVFLSLVAGVFFSLLGSVIATIMSIGYAMTKVTLSNVWAYALSKKEGIAFILIALIFNAIVSISPYMVKIFD